MIIALVGPWALVALLLPLILLAIALLYDRITQSTEGLPSIDPVWRTMPDTECPLSDLLEEEAGEKAQLRDAELHEDGKELESIATRSN